MKYEDVTLFRVCNKQKYGRMKTFGYYTDFNNAGKRAAEEKASHVDEVPGLLRSDGVYFVLEVFMEVDVDLPSRQEVLDKLTDRDRRTLGL